MAVPADAVGVGLAASAFALGLRHGFDVDHLAAIGDIAGTERSPRRTLALAGVYAAAHGLVVLVLGAVAVLAGDVVPDAVDGVMGRVAGISLVLMGLYVLVGLVRHGTGFRPRSRWGVALDAAARARKGLRTDRHADEHRHRRAGPGGYRWPAVAGIGVLHGIGAETPTQVLLFVAAAGAGGAAAGLAALACFVAGLLVANTAVAVVAAAAQRAAVTGALTVVSGVFSVGIGGLLLRS